MVPPREGFVGQVKEADSTQSPPPSEPSEIDDGTTEHTDDTEDHREGVGSFFQVADG
jgi:hypothetical protein